MYQTPRQTRQHGAWAHPPRRRRPANWLARFMERLEIALFLAALVLVQLVVTHIIWTAWVTP